LFIKVNFFYSRMDAAIWSPDQWHSAKTVKKELEGFNSLR